MTRDEAITRAQRLLAQRAAGDFVTQLQDALKDAQVRLEQAPLLPWFLRGEVHSISTVDTEERITLPPGFIREWEEDAVWYFDGAATDVGDVWTPLVKDELEFLRKNLPGVGKPEAYAFDGTYWRIFPTPDGVYTIKVIFYKQDVVLVSNTENKWLLHASDVMVGMAGGEVARGIRDLDGIKIFDDMLAAGAARLETHSEALEHAGRRYVMGGVD